MTYPYHSKAGSPPVTGHRMPDVWPDTGYPAAISDIWAYTGTGYEKA